jgi:two-component system, NtrC family, response regulator HydG
MQDQLIHILVVDDDQQVLHSIERQLRKEKEYVIDIIDNPAIVLQKLKEKAYDLVLCDIRMKPMSGLDVVKDIHLLDPLLPVIFLTGYVDDEIMIEAQAIGSNDFLMKPIRRHDLIYSIQKVLATA